MRYRPISVLNGINKVFEKLLYKQISTYLEENTHIPHFQYGYRRNHSTQMAIMDFYNYVRHSINTNQYTIAVFMDLSKAFDTVDKERLYTKMQNLGFESNSNNLIYSYMSGRTFCFTNDEEQYSLKYGVPQGSVLGPLLFIVYNQDMNHLCPETKKIGYADDTTLLITGRNKQEAEKKANIVLQHIYSYFTCNKLSINPSKTKYLIFTKAVKKNTELSPKLILGGVEIESTIKIKFLGMIITKSLDWTEHKSYIKNKISQSTGILYSSRNTLNYKDMLMMYRTFIEPLFMYCLPIWGHSIKSETDDLIRLQNKTLRILFSCFRSEDAWRHTEGHILTLKNLVKHETAKFCFKHHFNSLPQQFSEDNMPIIANPSDLPYSFRPCHYYKYSYSKHKNEIINKA